MAGKQFDPHFWSLEDVFKPVYEVPVYQRPYSWDIEEAKTLLEDLNAVYFSNEKNDGYFIGNIIIHDQNEKINGNILKFDIIDGQQRITTFSLILLAIYTIAVKNGFYSNDPTVGKIKTSLWKYFGRQYHKEYRTVSLKSIEKECFSNLYDYCFQAETLGSFDSIEYCNQYAIRSRFEERVIKNYKFIYEYLNNNVVKGHKNTEILDYADFLLQNAQFIIIEAQCKENKVFSIFESINSKGKKLDEIDLFKTYIFSNLSEDDYDLYLNRWGQLIIQTEDNLYDYIYNYIKAFICFYRQNIYLKNFKLICNNEMQQYYKVSSAQEAIKAFIDDLYRNVKYYKMLSSTNMVHELVKSNKLRYYYKVFTEIGYKHPKPLFLRTLIEFDEKKIDKNTTVDVIVETVKFMLEFLTITGRDSKDAISMFSKIMNETYAKGTITKEIVINNIAAELMKQAINKDSIKQNLLALDAYEQNKKLAVAVLAVFDSSKKENGKVKVSYDQAYTILNSFSDSFSLDHLLVQTPEEGGGVFKYYKDKNTERLVLLEGNDFPKESVADGMDYDLFTKTILNRIGNLRVYYKDKNSGRQNTTIDLKEYPNFTTYKSIKDRGEEVVSFLTDEILTVPKVDISKIQLNTPNEDDDTLPKLDKLIEFGIVNPGDKLYLVNYPDTSTAELIDSKYVSFNGEKMTVNEWGKKVTGWQSIRIYSYAAKVGDIDTLQDKRLQYIENNNENSIDIS